jgi:hypothetical protein
MKKYASISLLLCATAFAECEMPTIKTKLQKAGEKIEKTDATLNERFKFHKEVKSSSELGETDYYVLKATQEKRALLNSVEIDLETCEVEESGQLDFSRSSFEKIRNLRKKIHTWEVKLALAQGRPVPAYDEYEGAECSWGCGNI